MAHFELVGSFIELAGHVGTFVKLDSITLVSYLSRITVTNSTCQKMNPASSMAVGHGPRAVLLAMPLGDYSVVAGVFHMRAKGALQQVTYWVLRAAVSFGSADLCRRAMAYLLFARMWQCGGFLASLYEKCKTIAEDRSSFLSVIKLLKREECDMGAVNYHLINSKMLDRRKAGASPSEIFYEITTLYPAHDLPVNEKVELSGTLLKCLTREERMDLCRLFIQEQVLDQRNRLNRWGTVTAQSSQIDTGYIAQHLVSLQTQIPGQGMRGKGDDLSDGSEVKSANFLDSLDKKGATAPSWNFTAVTQEIMEKFLTYDSLFLLSMDLNTLNKFRVRIWKIDISKHDVLRNRYIEWMNKLGYPKFRDADRPSVNFQLFPPHSGTEETHARHGNGRANGFSSIQIPLENHAGAELIFRADDTANGVEISVF